MYKFGDRGVTRAVGTIWLPIAAHFRHPDAKNPAWAETKRGLENLSSDIRELTSPLDHTMLYRTIGPELPRGGH